VAATREGDLAAFEELVRRYRVRMTRLAHRFTQNVEDARDLSQDGFVRAYENLHRYRLGTKFHRWLCRIVANAARDFLRRRRHLPSESPDGDADGTPSRDPTPLAAAEANDLRSALRRELASLPESWRLVFALHEQEGHKHDEIAKALGENARTVRWWLYKARKRLRERLADYLVD
jgi:RNA polymerase sigma-70 factor (ECF subfamily)